MTKYKIWSLGDAVVDLLPQDNCIYEACAGGAPANVAIGISKLGLQAGFIGRVGNDPFGHFIAETLKKYRVDCQSLEFDSKRKTSTVVVNLDKNGDRNFTFLVSPSADQFLSQAALPNFGKDILHFCSLALVGEACRETLHYAVSQVIALNGKISFDINLREQMWEDSILMRDTIISLAKKADLLKLSSEELCWLVDDENMANALEKLAHNYPAELKIITKGSDGCSVIWKNKCFQYSAYPVNCIDTTGAGDAFVAGCLSSLAGFGMPQLCTELDAMISIASACGALSTTSKGALTNLPTKAYLDEFISINGFLKGAFNLEVQ